VNLKHDISSLSDKKRALLELLRKERKVELPDISRSNVGGPVPLSSSQQRLWFLEHLEPANIAYNIALAYRLKGPFDAELFERALQAVVSRQEVLRSCIREADGEATQAGATEVYRMLAQVDLSGISEESRYKVALDLAVHDARTPIDLNAGPLFRALLIRLTPTDHVFHVTIHHIVCDGWSMDVIYRDLTRIYNAFAIGHENPLPELKVRFADYVRWQKEHLASDAATRHLEYWKTELAGVPDTLELPVDHQFPPQQDFRGGRERATISPDLAVKLRQLSSEHNASLFMTMLAAWQVCLFRYSNQREFIVGFPVAGRPTEALDTVVGLFANTLPLRVQLASGQSFLELLQDVRRRVIEAMAHQDAPVERIIDALKLERDPSRPPLFQTMFSLNTPVAGPALTGTTAELIPIGNSTTKFPLSMEVMEETQGLSCCLEFNTSLFDARTARQLVQHFERLLFSIVAVPSMALSRLPMVVGKERQMLLNFGQGLPNPYPKNRPIQALFEEWVARTPEKVAAVYGQDQVTYSDLNRRANQLARHLCSLGVRKGEVISTNLPRSIDLLVALLAILKCGAVYTSLDSSYPDDRLEFMARDTGVRFLIGYETPRWAKSLENITTISPNAAKGMDDDAVDGGADGEAAAYVCYTSGSTGQAKGVLVPHRGVTRMVRNQDFLSVRSTDRVAHLSNTSFDAAVFEIWCALLNGATLVVFDRNSLLDPRSLVADMRRHRVNVLFLITAYFNEVVREVPDPFRSMDTVMFGGEAGDPRVARKVLGGGRPKRLINLYGPAESATLSTWFDCDTLSPEAAVIPIGRPLANTQVYVLDEHLEPSPIGVRGVIYVGGDGLALGYLNRPELTSERFIPNPFHAGQKLYFTGDTGYLLPDGSVQFCGRTDEQVKIRGFRIEPGEVEAVLRGHAGVDSAAVIVREDVPGDKRLVAYVVAADKALAAQDLKAYCQTCLPEYMIPAHFVLLDRMPASPNGKLDRKQLLGLPLRVAQASPEPFAPETAWEHKIREVWRDVLGLDHIGRNDNFFDLGGHSLLLLRVHARLRDLVDRELPVVSLLQHPTVSALAKHLGEAEFRAPFLAQSPVAKVAEPIAIVGMAGRFPGASGVEELWSNLRDGIAGVRFFSDEDLAAAGVARETIAQANYVKAAGVVGRAEFFDARYFGMTPREAEITDPQHRVFLECAHEALENAGCDPDSYRGSIGVFAGSSAGTYIDNIRNSPIGQNLGPLQLLVGNDKDFLPTRVSYKLNLRGPSVNIQTACSTSLVAVHMACQSLLEGACDTALAGGVCIRFPQPSGYLYVEDGIMAPDGHCRTFDADAQGTVPANGAGVVVLKRLSAAIADRDRIYAVIKGSAINNDGSMKLGYTAPSVDGQSQVITKALSAADVDPATVSFVEAHGTGTNLGDPIEITALTKAFRAHTDATEFCAIGSAKSSLGHLDAAAGVTGLIKSALQLHHQQIAPSLHFERPNPKIDFARSPFFVNSQLRNWPIGGAPRRALVSSFGIGGTNAHAVLEEAPVLGAAVREHGCYILPLAAKTQPALEQAAVNLSEFLKTHPDQGLADVAYTLQTGRTVHSHRAAFVCETREQAIDALRGPFTTVTTKHDAAPSLAFLFPGQGSQRVNMARSVYEAESVFRRELDRCAELLIPHLDGTDIRNLLYPGLADDEASTTLNQTAIAQPVLFSIEYALAQLWLSLGVRPNAMIGHSIGEYVAACLAGVLSLEDALCLVAWRGKLMQDLPKGAMLVVNMPEDEALAFSNQRLSVAAVNALKMCVLSGPEEQIAWAEAELAEGVFCRRLHTSHAFHSSMMDGALDEFRLQVSRVTLSPPTIPYISNVSGTWISPSEATDPEYWVQHLRGCVRFHSGLEELRKAGTTVCLEVGYGETLVSIARSSFPDFALVSSLPNPKASLPESKHLGLALARLWESGIIPNWNEVADPESRHIALPTYPFERQRYWIEPSDQKIYSPSKNSRNDFSEWFYIPSWSRSVAVTQDLVPETGTRFLLFADTTGVAEQLARDLEANGALVVTVVRGRKWTRLSEKRIAMDTSSPQDYVRLLSELSDHNSFPDKIIHLLNVSNEIGSAAEALESGYYSLLWLAQAAGTHHGRKLEILAVASNALNVLGTENGSPVKATAIGIARVLPQESQNTTCRFVDVDIAASKSDIALQVRNEAARPAANHTVMAYRGKFRWVERFEKRQPDLSGKSLLLKKRGVYLVTGGRGGVGIEIATYLASTVGARLVLVGRRGLPPRDEWNGWLRANPPDDPVSKGIECVRRIEAAGGEVLVLAADLSKKEDVAKMVESTLEVFGPVDGLIHAAGVSGGGLIVSQTRQSSDAVFASKILGTLNLCLAFADRRLDFFVLCSSLRSWMGAPGRVEYCAANAFLDAVAQQAGFLPARVPVSIAWDAWAETGMGMIPQQGMELIPNEAANAMTNAEGVAAFQAILANPSPAVIVSTADLGFRLDEHRLLTTERVIEGFAASRPSLSAHPRPEMDTEFVEPSTAAELALAAIWQDLLGIERVGRNDNFFELGGDSVVAIQVIGCARGVGLKLTPAQMFQHQTIAALGELADTGGSPIPAEQSTVTGDLALTPIQHWFFEQEFAERNHFNLAILLRSRKRLDAEYLRTAVSKLQSHHDALRLRFHLDDGRWIQTNSGEQTVTPFETLALHSVSDQDLETAIDRECTAMHASLDITDGPIFKVVLLDTRPDEQQLVLITLHHLVSDLVTLRIISEDLQTLYLQVASGEALRLSAKTTSFLDWSHQLHRMAESGYFDGELDYWTAPGRSLIAPLPTTRIVSSGSGAESSASISSARMSAEETQALLVQLPKKLGVQVLPILVAGLVEAICDWSGAASMLLDVEGLGRQGLAGPADLSRTVGWFTPMYPMFFNRSSSTRELVGSVAAAFQELPNYGIGYGALRYLTGRPEIEKRFLAMPKADVSFLYRGNSEALVGKDELFVPAPDRSGDLHAHSTPLTHRITADVAIQGGRLGVRLVYSLDLYDSDVMDDLAQRFIDALRNATREILLVPEPTGLERDAEEFGLAKSDMAQISAWLASAVMERKHEEY
jgi:amino acid adenylation domain-containing protein/non-ribosomal peptide synthase protein (TIGR01720 family)